MQAYPHQAWLRLGRLLQERRGQLDPTFTKRTRFADAVGVNLKTLVDIEKAARTTFSDATLAAIETAYQWRPGSIRAVLEGGDPAPYEPTVRISEISASTEPVANVPVDDELAEWISKALQDGEDPKSWDFTEPLERQIFTYPDISWTAKRLMRGSLREALADAARAHGRATSTNGDVRP